MAKYTVRKTGERDRGGYRTPVDQPDTQRCIMDSHLNRIWPSRTPSLHFRPFVFPAIWQWSVRLCRQYNFTYFLKLLVVVVGIPWWQTISQIATHLYQFFTLSLVRGSAAPKVHLVILRPPGEAVSSSTIVVVLVLVADSQPYDFHSKIA